MIQVEEVRELDSEWQRETGLPPVAEGRIWVTRLDSRPFVACGVRRVTMLSPQELWLAPCQEFYVCPRRSVRLIRRLLRELIDEVGPLVAWTESGRGCKLAKIAGLKVVRQVGPYWQLEAK